MNYFRKYEYRQLENSQMIIKYLQLHGYNHT